MRSLKKALCTALAAVGLMAGAAQGQVVISQVYGGGGNGGAPYTNDFVELFNKSAVAADVSGWILHYSSATGAWGGTNNYTFPAATSIPANSYFLVQLQGGATGVPLPTPDLSSTAINMSGTSGKIALLNALPLLSGNCPALGANVADMVGFGSANCSIGSPTGVLSNSTAAIRNNSGCSATGSNATDFTVGAPTPRNSASSFVCTPTTPPTGTGSASPATACPGTLVTFTVNVTPGTFPPSTMINVTGNFLTIALGAAEQFVEGPANTWTFSTTLLPISPGAFSFPITISDAESRLSMPSINMNITTCDPAITSGTGVSPSGICNESSTTFTVVVQPGQNPASATIGVSLDLLPIGGSATQAMTEGPANTFTYTANVPAATPAGAKVINITVTDDQLRMDTGTFNIVTSPCTNSTSQVVISQVYGGGGNAGATFRQDFIELFNRGSTAVDLTGWSVQYGSATDANNGLGSGVNPATNVPTMLSGMIQPGGYYLVQLAAGAGGSVDIPTPDATGGLTLGATAGRVALVRNMDAVLINCADPDIADFVGYGSTAVCSEGAVGPTTTLENTTAAFRQLNGCQDTDQNRIDFFTAAPNPRNTATAANPCQPLPTGACCVYTRLGAFNFCTANVTQAACQSTAAAPKVWREAQACASCETSIAGACCVTNSCVLTSADDCAEQGGSFQSVGSVCSVATCPNAVGACCPSAGACSVTTSALCGLANGTFQGVNSTCTPDPCTVVTTGACCCGANCSITTAAGCPTIVGSTGQVFAGVGTACAPLSRNVPCCRGDFNKSGGNPSVQDIFDFLAAYFGTVGGGPGCADANDSGGTSVQDIFDFLAFYFAGAC